MEPETCVFDLFRGSGNPGVCFFVFDFLESMQVLLVDIFEGLVFGSSKTNYLCFSWRLLYELNLFGGLALLHDGEIEPLFVSAFSDRLLLEDLISASALLYFNKPNVIIIILLLLIEKYLAFMLSIRLILIVLAAVWDDQECWLFWFAEGFGFEVGLFLVEEII